VDGHGLLGAVRAARHELAAVDPDDELAIALVKDELATVRSGAAPEGLPRDQLDTPAENLSK